LEAARPISSLSTRRPLHLSEILCISGGSHCCTGVSHIQPLHAVLRLRSVPAFQESVLLDPTVLIELQAAADLFESLQAARVRIATRDLKIAAITLTSNDILLTANCRDFEKVPGLRFENWLE
jgi:predicted nucleic acid-binding protein